MSRTFPFFFQKMVGDGVPLGAAQIKRAVPPLTTLVSLGSRRNLSLSTVIKNRNMMKVSVVVKGPDHSIVNKKNK